MVKGGAGLCFAGFFSTLLIVKVAPMHAFKNSRTSSFLSNLLFRVAESGLVVVLILNSAVTLN